LPSPVSRWKAPRSRGIQKKDKKGSEAPTGAPEPLFTIGAVTATSQFSVAVLSVKTGRPQTLRCPRIINVFPLKMPRATRRAFKSLYPPPKGAQDHIRSISASTSSMWVAQLVAMRTTVWVSSNFSQKPNFALPSSAASWVFSSTRKIWLVGESIKKR
jgi:hypothetical protein